jgi:hypothetical protein
MQGSLDHLAGQPDVQFPVYQKKKKKDIGKKRK